MGWMDGLSQCWLLSATCSVDWAAWSAVGTVGAVVVSLVLARNQGRKEKNAQRSRARWVALELRQVLAAWRIRVTHAHRANGADLFSLLDGDGYQDPTAVPEDLRTFYDQLHVLGDDAAPIADAIWIARQLQHMPVRHALKGNIESQVVADSIELQFRAGLDSLRRYLLDAEQNVSAITGLSSAEPESWTFGVPYQR